MTAASPTARAEALLAVGRAEEAVAVAREAAGRGDVDSLMRLATWRLIGEPLARDLGEARALLRRAVEIGHVDAALMEIALVANGSGGPPDWPRALALLETAARGDPVAAAQLRLVRAMALGPDGSPPRAPVWRQASASPDVRHFPALFTPAECLHLAQVAEGALAPTMVADPATGRLIPHPIRTSDGMAIGPAQEDLVVRALNLRIAAASGTDVAQGEPLTVLRYAPRQQYRAHHDALPGVANQRGWTMLVYLNEGYDGGETRFLATGLAIRGRRGDGVLFHNLLDDGRPDPSAQHAGLPVTRGHKWLCTRWIRLAPYDAWGDSQSMAR